MKGSNHACWLTSERKSWPLGPGPLRNYPYRLSERGPALSTCLPSWRPSHLLCMYQTYGNIYSWSVAEGLFCWYREATICMKRKCLVWLSMQRKSHEERREACAKLSVHMGKAHVKASWPSVWEKLTGMHCSREICWEKRSCGESIAQKAALLSSSVTGKYLVWLYGLEAEKHACKQPFHGLFNISLQKLCGSLHVTYLLRVHIIGLKSNILYIFLYHAITLIFPSLQHSRPSSAAKYSKKAKKRLVKAEEKIETKKAGLCNLAERNAMINTVMKWRRGGKAAAERLRGARNAVIEASINENLPKWNIRLTSACVASSAETK